MKRLILRHSLSPRDWLSFDSNITLLVSEHSLPNWEGSADPDYETWAMELPDDYVSVLNINGVQALYFGDMPAACAMTLASWENEADDLLVIWKWLGAPVGYVLPMRIDIPVDQSLDSDRIELIRGDYFLCDASAPGSAVLGCPTAVRSPLQDGMADIRYFEINPSPDLPKALFGAYIFSLPLGATPFQRLRKPKLT